jgi:uncharacterized protein (UPF0335 family)
MAKKAESVSRGQLEAKIADLEQKRQKVANLIDQYTDVYKKMDGAIEILIAMLQELKVEEPVKTENNDDRKE